MFGGHLDRNRKENVQGIHALQKPRKFKIDKYPKIRKEREEEKQTLQAIGAEATSWGLKEAGPWDRVQRDALAKAATSLPAQRWYCCVPGSSSALS